VLVAIGYIVILASVFGGYMLAGGHLGPLFQPTELLIIFGAGIGAFVVGNDKKAINATVKAIPGLFKGSKYTKALYMEVMALLYVVLSKIRREGMMSIEADIEAPHESALFANYPTIQADHHALDFICDYLRLMVGGNLIASALVGTFLGILLAYGFIGPLGSLLEQRAEESTKLFQCIKVTLLASMNGYAPAIAVEFGRKVLFSTERPSFAELEDHVRGAKTA
jgi:chemotaxis protein MotA